MALYHYVLITSILFRGALVKLRKETIAIDIYVCPSVYPSVRTEQLGSHWKDFHEI